MTEELAVIHRDERLLVVDKPSGMLVHRGWGRDEVTLVDLARRAVGGGAVHPVHRIDRGTSGVVVLALDREAARRLGEALARGDVDKRYLALVRGRPPSEGVVDHPIPRRPGGPRVPSMSSFRLVETKEVEPRTVSLVAVRPRTGRLHQVRRHLKHISHPVIGDANYGKGSLNRAFRALYGLDRLALHAGSISFQALQGEETLVYKATVPPHLAGALARIGFQAGSYGQAWADARE